MNGTSSNPLADGIGCGSIWKSPRDRTRSIEATLREFKGNSYADFRVLQLDASGRMVPTGKGLTVSIRQLGKFSKLIGDTYRKAHAMGLITGGSS